MAYSEDLAERIRDILALDGDVVEKKMFGGVCYMTGGNMGVGIVKDELMVRVGPDEHEDALAEPHVRPMDFAGRPMKGMVYVAVPGIAADADLRRWVERGMTFARSLPRKKG